MLALGVGVGSNANFSVRIRGNTNFSVFRHVGIPNAKLWHWGSKPTRGPNVNGFALQWNIGLSWPNFHAEVFDLSLIHCKKHVINTQQMFKICGL